MSKDVRARVIELLTVLDRPEPADDFESFDQVLAKGAAEKELAAWTGIPRLECTPAAVRRWLAR